MSNSPRSFWWIPDHPSSPFLTHCAPLPPPPQYLYRGWWGISVLAWSIFLDVVQREGPDLIYYTCQLNFWRCTLMHRGWIMYAGCVFISLIIISGHATEYDDFCTWWKTQHLKFFVKNPVCIFFMDHHLGEEMFYVM